MRAELSGMLQGGRPTESAGTLAISTRNTMHPNSSPTATTGLRVGLVVPCYNEADRMAQWEFLRFARRHPWVHYYFVDDGSTDETYHTLLQMERTLPHAVSVLRLPRNVGKAEAVRQGLRVATAEANELVGYWDADLAAPLAELPRLRDVFLRHTNVRIVMGVRRRLLGRRIRRGRLRGVLGAGFAWTASQVLRMPRCDTQCGAKLFRNDGLLRAILERPFQSRWIFDVELLARYRAALGKRRLLEAIYEQPLDQWADVSGSKLKPSDFVRALFELLRLAGMNHRVAAGAGKADEEGQEKEYGKAA